MTAIANIFAIFQKELQGYFASPFAYIVAAIFWFLSGFFWIGILIETLQEVAFIEQQGIPGAIDVPYIFILRYFGILGLLALFIFPLLSMGLYVEERKRSTLELLATSPLTNWSVAVGKLLAVTAFTLFTIAPILLYEAIAFASADPPMPPAVPLSALLGIVLLATSILSLGMFISSLCDNTVLSGLLTFALMLLLWIVDLVADRVASPFREILTHLSLLKHYNNFVQGIIDSSSIVLFASYIFLGIFLTAQSIETFRFSRR